MASLDGFDARTVEASAPIGPIPAGDYIATIVNSERKATRSGNGDMLMVEFAIQCGDYSGRKIKAHLNLWNMNENAKQIAWKDMSAICHAIGVMQPKDTTDLHGIPMQITVAVGNPNADGKVYNEIKGYSKRPTAEAAAQPSPEKPGWA